MERMAHLLLVVAVMLEKCEELSAFGLADTVFG